MAPSSDLKAKNEEIMKKVKAKLSSMQRPMVMNSESEEKETKTTEMENEIIGEAVSTASITTESSVKDIVIICDLNYQSQILATTKTGSVMESKKAEETRDEISAKTTGTLESEMISKKNVQELKLPSATDYKVIADSLVSLCVLSLDGLSKLCRSEDNVEVVAFLLTHVDKAMLKSPNMGNIFIGVCNDSFKNIARVMIESGVDVDIRDGTYGSTALMYAAQRGNLEMVRFLIEHGANVLKKNIDNRYKALDYALGLQRVFGFSKHKDCIAILKEVEAIVRLKKLRTKYGDLFREECFRQIRDPASGSFRAELQEEFKEELKTQILEEIITELFTAQE